MTTNPLMAPIPTGPRLAGPLAYEETGANQILLKQIKTRIAQLRAQPADHNHYLATATAPQGSTAPAPKVAGAKPKEAGLLSEGVETGLNFLLPPGLAGAAKKTDEAVGIPTPESLAETGENAAPNVAGEVASGLVGDAQSAFGAALPKALLYIVCVGGGLALIFSGVSRVTGARKPKLKDLAIGAAAA
jgi:hypothetical protein